jgi:hypothetical protein
MIAINAPVIEDKITMKRLNSDSDANLYPYLIPKVIVKSPIALFKNLGTSLLIILII